MTDAHHYRVYDFYLASTFPLPELWAIQAGDTQLFITDQETIPEFEEVERAGWMYEDFLHIQTGPAGVILLIKDVCRIWLKNTNTLVIEPLPGVDLNEARVYLLGSGLALYLMNQGYFTLHAGTVTKDGKSFSFMGPSGVGKSTTCTYFLDRGYQLLADDVSLLKPLGPKALPLVYSAMPALKLWPDSLNHLQRNPEDLPLVMNSESKRRLSIQDAFSTQEKAPLSCIFLLDPDENVQQATLTRLQGKVCFDALASNIYRAEAVTWLGQTANHFRFCSHLAQQVPVFRLQRPLEPFNVESIYHLVEKTLSALA